MSSPPRQRLLGIYLNDHLTGATGGVGLAHRLAESFDGSPDSRELADLADQISSDRQALLDVMRELHIPVSRVKTAAGWLGEKAGRLNLNGRLVKRSPLSDVVELEAMTLGVAGKLAGWRALRTVSEGDAGLDPSRFDRLIARAEEQLVTLEEIRARAVEHVLARRATATAGS